MKEIGIETARQLIDFSGGQLQNRAWAEQLEGAVALHNILVKHSFAYLADEVGMGKTYVALGVVALMRHFNPDLRVLYIAPRENIQQKWKKELLNFTANNWRVTDNRVRSFRGSPAYPLALCAGLSDLARKVVLDANRDFMLRLTSFSLPLSAQPDFWARKRDDLLDNLPLHQDLDRSVFDLRDKETFKDNYARAINTVLPQFDLLVVDEGHNLKHGLESSAARNRVLAFVLGHPAGKSRDFPQYGKRFERVLVLSATPLETSYQELWQQLNLFGSGQLWNVLKDNANDEATERAKEEAVRQFMVRRLTGLQIGGELYTKNMYRREWRHGGVRVYDEPLDLANEQQRLIVALVQKKVAEVIGSERFNHSFQIGMLASFESFTETAKVTTVEDDQVTAFDDPAQSDDLQEREGIDRPSINRIARSYRYEFGRAMPHPKMDALVDSLAANFATGTKTLVFVRRIKSVPELAEKLNERYDRWLEQRVMAKQPEALRQELERVFERYREERRIREPRNKQILSERASSDGETSLLFVDEQDPGDIDNFFAWFFRGEGPSGFFSGASFNHNRLSSEGSAYSTLFEDNYIAWLLGARDDLVSAFAQEIGATVDGADDELRQRAFSFFRQSSRQKKFPRLRVFLAYQAAALALLADKAQNVDLQAKAQIIYREKFGAVSIRPREVARNFPAPEEYLKQRTFFTELGERPMLQNELWPNESEFNTTTFRRREQRRELLAATARLGHPFIDLWLVALKRLGTLRMRDNQRLEGGAVDLIRDFLDLLEQQKEIGADENTAYRELSLVSTNFDLLIAVNFPEVRDAPLNRLTRIYGSRLARQSPVAGMWGQFDKNKVAQFRMPGYPLILITTDILQEGEDLHTFCANIVHYGISWTPSAMEQRIGRIDRINSLTQRRLDNHLSVSPEELLQVYYPYLRDTVERLQVQRVFKRMNRFIQMMYRSLTGEHMRDSRINTLMDFSLPVDEIEPIRTPLKTAYGLEGREEILLHPRWGAMPIRNEFRRRTQEHFLEMQKALREVFNIEVTSAPDEWSFWGTVFLTTSDQLCPPGVRGARQQPFALSLQPAKSHGRILLHCTSPIGFVPRDDYESIERISAVQQRIEFGKICAIPDDRLKTYNLTAEGDLLFDSDMTRSEEAANLLERTTLCADMMERALLDKDEPMQTFQNDLIADLRYG